MTDVRTHVKWRSSLRAVTAQRPRRSARRGTGQTLGAMEPQLNTTRRRGAVRSTGVAGSGAATLFNDGAHVTDREHAHEHDHQDVIDDLRPQHRDLRRAIPDVYKGFAELSRAATAPGAVDPAIKELIAVAIGVVDGCDGCIATHVRAAVKAGATREQAAEILGVAIMMKGGPATIYGARAFTAFNEFADAETGGETDA
jgi:AhpD family alkylhydroperoxidase